MGKSIRYQQNHLAAAQTGRAFAEGAGMSREASYGWERWPVRMTLDGTAYLCRWCAKPLKGGQNTAYCSRNCEHEILIRCNLKSMRNAIYDRDKGVCRACGVSIDDLRQAFKWYSDLWHNKDHWTNRWPTPSEFLKAAGFASAGHLWEMNHIVAVVEGGEPIDPQNLETLCLKCHKKHTAELAKKLARLRKDKIIQEIGQGVLCAERVAPTGQGESKS
jgi:5-methylcytosine-specific restriction endonuclease McrA